MKKVILFLPFVFAALCCSKNSLIQDNDTDQVVVKNLSIFFVNDQHGRLENFAKIKHIVDLEEQNTQVIVACSGDIFSGNPVVDNHEQKGYPIIDVMNRAGFDISVIGNHEFDYGESALKNRIEQAEFEWVCANVDMGNTGIPEPFEYYSLQLEELKVTFLGLVETNGKQNATIPSTHPWKVQNIGFERPENVVFRYADVKNQENSDLYIALTHIGHTGFNGVLGDFQLAEQFPYFDLIIGGHTNQLLDTVINNIPIFQAGNNLNFLGKISLEILDKKVESHSFELIDLNNYPNSDQNLKSVIDGYNEEAAHLNQIIGFSHRDHQRFEVGCFFTDALKGQLNVDVTFQNSGGVRSGLDQGEISQKEIYQISPFNNGTVIYNMTVSDIVDFMIGSRSGFYYSGISIVQVGQSVQLRNLENIILSDESVLTVGINDYIPAVYDTYFPNDGVVQSSTSAETLIQYLTTKNDQVNYSGCDRFFRFR